MRWHEDDDLIAVDNALRESLRLVRGAELELGDLPVATEVLASCEKQLSTKLAGHVRKANRHELRMLFADFCQHEEREELQKLCLDKYREQVRELRLVPALRAAGASAAAAVAAAAVAAAAAAAAAAPAAAAALHQLLHRDDSFTLDFAAAVPGGSARPDRGGADTDEADGRARRPRCYCSARRRATAASACWRSCR